MALPEEIWERFRCVLRQRASRARRIGHARRIDDAVQAARARRPVEGPRRGHRSRRARRFRGDAPAWAVELRRGIGLQAAARRLRPLEQQLDQQHREHHGSQGRASMLSAPPFTQPLLGEHHGAPEPAVEQHRPPTRPRLLRTGPAPGATNLRTASGAVLPSPGQPHEPNHELHGSTVLPALTVGGPSWNRRGGSFRGGAIVARCSDERDPAGAGGVGVSPDRSPAAGRRHPPPPNPGRRSAPCGGRGPPWRT